MRLTRIGIDAGALIRTRLDLVILHEGPVPVEELTWGKIKALYQGR